MTALLDIQNVNQGFRSGFWMKKTQILFDVSLQVPERAVFGFLGANGAGKTTLIHLMVGIRRPISGSVKIAGFDAYTPAARSKVGYLPERPYFYDHLTGEGVLKYFGTLSGMSGNKLTSRIDQVLSIVGMAHAKRLELKKYSKGMLQRIGIAQAILHEPEFLILDEPMSGLDPVGRKEIRELILQLSSQGHTILFSSHVIPDVEAICDQVALIQKGKMVGCGPIGNFLAQGPIQTEIAFSGVSGESAGRIPELSSIKVIPDGVRGSVQSQDAVNRVLKGLLEMNAKILWVTPVRTSLEERFASEAKSGTV